QAQALKRLRTGHLMDEVAVDIDQAGAVFAFVDQVVVPDLVVKSLLCGHFRSIRRLGLIDADRRSASTSPANGRRQARRAASASIAMCRARKRQGSRARSSSA